MTIDLAAVAQKTLIEMQDSGEIEKIIKAQLVNTVTAVVKSEMREYSDFGKSLTEHVKKSLGFSLDELKIDEYHELLRNMIEREYGAFLEQQGRGKFLEHLKEVFEPAVDSIKLQDLINIFIEHNEESAMSESIERCGFKLSRSSSSLSEYIDISLWRSGEESKNYCSNAINFGLKPTEELGKYTIWRIKDSSERILTEAQLKTAIYGFERTLYSMYCHGSIIEIDPDELDEHSYETYYGWCD